MSVQLSTILSQGYQLLDVARSMSQLSLLVNGVDHTKYRLPRDRGHALDRASGATVSATTWPSALPMEKGDTNNAIKTITHMLNSVKDRHGRLPMGLHIQ